MKNIRAVVKVTIIRPKRRPMVDLSSSVEPGLAGPHCFRLSLVPAGPPRPGPFQLVRSSRVDVNCRCKCNFPTLIDSCFRAVLCAGIQLEPAQIPLLCLT